MKKEIVTFATMAIGILATRAVAQQATDSTSPASSGATTVNDLAADPSGYLGQVAVVGVVAAVKAGQGFTIVDKAWQTAYGFDLSDVGCRRVLVPPETTGMQLHRSADLPVSG